MTTKNETSITIDRRDMETGTVSINSRAVDDALPFLQSYDHAILLDEDAEKALVKKIDWMVLPFLSVIAFLQFLDKSLRKLCSITSSSASSSTVKCSRANSNPVSYANVMGLEKDTHSDAAQFSYLATAFYVAYFIFELPSGYLIQRLPLAKYLGANGKICPAFQNPTFE